jgi:hypothetical protein
MSFINLHLIDATAQQHQQALVEHAVEFRLVRQARRQHPSTWRPRSHSRGRPDAA